MGNSEVAAHAVPVHRLTGTRVRNRAGEDLGTIEDLVVDLASGKIIYAALAFGGFLGIGNKLFAVPWDALTLRGDGVVVDATREELEQMPGFDPDNWPENA